LNQLLAMIPGFNANVMKDIELDEKKMARVEAIIKSMTKEERNNPSIINGSRRKRIAAGSGTTVQEVNKLLKEFEEMKKMMKMMTEMGKRGKKGLKKIPNAVLIKNSSNYSCGR